FAEVLAPYLDRGVLALIGEATEDNLRTGVQRNEALRRLLEVVRCPEPSDEETRAILDARLAAAAQRHGLELSSSATVLDDVVDLSRVVSPSAARPGAAVALLEQVISARSERRTAGSIEGSEVIAALSRSTGMPVGLLDDRIAFDPAAVRAFFEDRV